MECGDLVVFDDGRAYRLVPGIGCGSLGAPGGTSVVFRARPCRRDGTALGPPDGDVAIKLVNPERLRDTARRIGDTAAARDDAADTMTREAEFLADVKARHPRPAEVNVIALVHHGTVARPSAHRGLPAIVMERCDFSLADVIDQNRRPADGAAHLARLRRAFGTLHGVLALVRDVADALDAMTRLTRPYARVAHRDLKPANLLFRDGRLRVSDFGTVKLFEEATRSVGGFTEDYMAPELRQAIFAARRTGGRELPATHVIDPSAGDIYSLGVTVFQVLIGRVPELQSSQRRLRHDREPTLSDDERRELRARIGALPADPGAPATTDTIDLDHAAALPAKGYDERSLPALGAPRQALCDLAVAMLAAPPEDRPAAAALADRSRSILDQLDRRLAPRAALKVKDAGRRGALRLDPDRPAALRVQVSGTGVPDTHCRWLVLRWDGGEMRCDHARPDGHGLWRIDWPRAIAGRCGRHRVSLRAETCGTPEPASVTLTVEVAAPRRAPARSSGLSAPPRQSSRRRQPQPWIADLPNLALLAGGLVVAVQAFPVAVTWPGPDPDRPAAVVRWSGAPGDLPEPLCRRPDGSLALEAGERLLITADVHDPIWPGPLHPLAVLEDPGRRARAYPPHPVAGRPCSRAVLETGARWCHALIVPPHPGRVTLAVLVRRGLPIDLDELDRRLERQSLAEAAAALADGHLLVPLRQLAARRCPPPGAVRSVP